MQYTSGSVHDVQRQVAVKNTASPMEMLYIWDPKRNVQMFNSETDLVWSFTF